MHVTKFLNYLNSKHRNIKFTVEREENNSLSFLDIKIFRDGGKFQTSVYRKSTFSFVLTNFESFLRISNKYNLASTLLHRGFMICSSHRILHFEIQKLKQIFWSNAYPKNLVDHCIKMYLHKVFIKRPNICIVPKTRISMHLVFIMAKQSATFMLEQLNIWEFHIGWTKVLKMLSSQLFHITCWLLTAT